MQSVMLRWTARVWSLASILVICAFAFGGAENMRPTAAEAIGLLLFPGGVIIGFIIAWWREGIGGIVSVVSLLIFLIWLYLRVGRLGGMQWFLLFAAPGFLHLMNAALRRIKVPQPV